MIFFEEKLYNLLERLDPDTIAIYSESPDFQ
jgi:hypothetical protein